MTEPRQLLPIASPGEAGRAVGRLIRPRWLLAVAAVTTLIAGVVASLAGPPLLGRIVDLVGDGNSDGIAAVAVGLLLVAIGQAIFTAAGSILVARLGEEVLADLRESVVDHALNLPIARIEEAGIGDLAARVGGDVAVAANAIRNVIPEFTIAGLNVGLTVVGLALLDWRFALAGLCAAPIQLLSLRLFLRRSGPIYAAQRTAESARAQALLDAIEGAPTAREFNLDEQQTARVAKHSRAATELTYDAVKVQTVFSSRLNGAEFVGLAAVLVTGFFLVRDGAVTIGATTAAALYFHRLFDPIGMLLSSFDEVLAAASGLRRLVGVAGDDPGDRTDTGEPQDASVTLQNVGFAYVPGQPVLNAIDLAIGDGERIALVGASGAGKTTIARLVAGHHPPGSGDVLLGGVEAATASTDRERRHVVLVAQEVHVFAGTIADDLRLARPGADETDLWRALERTGAAQWVRALASGIETTVGAGGHKLTAAQAQQLALTRLVLADPAIAVLDEATAEAGSAGARALEASASAALAGRTGLIVAHRLSQAVHADRIVVLADGRIVETGTHAELVAAHGAYAELWSAWAAAYRPQD